MSESRGDLARIVLSVLFIGGLIGGSIWVLKPFLGALIWAAMIVIATWPILLKLQSLLGGRRGAAVAVMTVVLLAALVVPLVLVTGALLERVGDVPALATKLAGAHVPPPPQWLGDIPFVGDRALATWERVAALRVDELFEKAAPYVREVAAWFGRQAGSIGLVLVQFVLTVVLCAVLYAGGESWAAWVRRFARQLAGIRGDRVTVLAGQAVRGVALGVVVTAILQSLLGGIGLAIAGVPFVSVLTAVMFVLCIAQIGPILVLLAATAWVYSQAGAGWGTFLLVWSLVVGLMDNFVRPVLIKKGADLPFLLIFAGVVGGLIAFGVVGIFVGPVVLAVAFTLLDDWVAEERPDAAGTTSATET
jgi:predicted PurR-regulated permease PerM